MAKSFDPYHVWLGIPPASQPPDFYRLLGLVPCESDPAVIDHAADRQIAHVRTFQNGRHADDCQRLLNELANARLRLLDPVAKAAYDEAFQRSVPPTEPPIVDYTPPTLQPRAPARRQTVNAAVVTMKVVLGGLAGIACGALLLQYFGRIDLFGSGSGPEGAPTDSRAVTGIDKTGAPPVANLGDRTIATKSNDPLPPADAVALQPAGKAERPIEESTESKKKSDDSDAAGPMPVVNVEGSEPAGPMDPPAPLTQAKQPVPSAEQQAIVRRQLDELYPPAATKLAGDKLKLAEELRKVARNSKGASEERFGLLRHASELAADGGDLLLAMAIVDELGADYDFDMLMAKQATISRFAAATASESAAEFAFEAVTLLVADAHRQSQYDKALQMADTLVEICQQPAGSKLRKQAVDVRNNARRLHEEWLAYRAAVTTLTTTPNDPTACLIAGRWLTLHENDWAGGLALLAKGENKDLAKAAKQDLATMLEGDAMLACGDRWYEVAKTSEADKEFLARAAHWYRQAQPKLTGLAQVRTVKRLAEIEESAPSQSSVTSSGESKWRDVTRWVGVAVHTVGPEAGVGYQRVELTVNHEDRSAFSARYGWAAYRERELSRGEYDIRGTVKNGFINWACKENGAKGHGSARDGVFFVAWKQPPYGGENWYVPTASQEQWASGFAGKYQIIEGGRAAFVLDLRPDGTAKKSHAPNVNGAWLAANDRALVVWADGWRDFVIKQDRGVKKEAFRPGLSLKEQPTNVGSAKRLD